MIMLIVLCVVVGIVLWVIAAALTSRAVSVEADWDIAIFFFWWIVLPVYLIIVLYLVVKGQ